MPITSTITGLLGRNRRSALSISNTIAQMQRQNPPLASALKQIETAIYQIENAMRAGGSTIEGLSVTNPAGAEIIRLDPRGWITIKDQSGLEVAWLGEQVDLLPLAITAATNASPAVLTVPGNTYTGGDTIIVRGATGNTNVNGFRIVQNVGIAGAGTFTMTDLSGNPINGNGAYSGTATAQRYYAGLLTQTVAIGESFANYKLRAFADGTLRIQNATIDLTSVSGGVTSEILLDPKQADIVVTSLDHVSGGRQLVLRNGQITLGTLNPDGTQNLDGSSATIEPGLSRAYNSGLTSLALSRVLDIYGYTGSTEYGPLLSLSQYRGKPTAATASQSGDTLGGFITWGFDGFGESQYSAGVRAVAAENHTPAAHGSRLVFEVTPDGTTTPISVATLDQDQTLNVIGGYKANGAPGTTGPVAYVRTVAPVTTTITYATPGGGSASTTVVTGINVTTGSLGFSGGIRTT